MEDIRGGRALPQAATRTGATTRKTARAFWLLICRERLSPRCFPVEAFPRVFLFARELVFPCNIAALCTPAGVHPDPLVPPFPDLFLDLPGGCGGRGARGSLSSARARNLDPSRHPPLHAPFHTIGGTEHPRGP